MRLYVNFEADEQGRERPVIVDDRGEPLPGIRAVRIAYDFEEATEVTIRLVVNRRDVFVGVKPEPGKAN